MFFVVLLRERRAHAHEFQAGNAQAAPLEAGDDLTDEATLKGIRLCQDERSFNQIYSSLKGRNHTMRAFALPGGLSSARCERCSRMTSEADALVPQIDATALASAVAGLSHFRAIRHLDTVESTNALAFSMLDDESSLGTSIIAEVQTAGRGRAGRVGSRRAAQAC